MRNSIGLFLIIAYLFTLPVCGRSAKKNMLCYATEHLHFSCRRIGPRHKHKFFLDLRKNQAVSETQHLNAVFRSSFG